MHALIESAPDETPALKPNAAIGPALRAIAGSILAKAGLALTDPERSNQDAVHDFRRAMKQWRALMRLLEPFIPDADRWRREGRDHARSLAQPRSMLWTACSIRACWSSRSARPARCAAVSKRCVEMRNRPCSPRRCAKLFSPGSTPRRPRSNNGRSIRSTFRTSPLSWPIVIAARGGAFRTIGRRRIRSICTDFASALSNCATRWNWSSRSGRGSAGCGPTKPKGCANGSGAARILKCCGTSPRRISLWRAGARGSPRHVPNAPLRSRSAPRASRIACSRKSPRRSGNAWKRCGSKGASALSAHRRGARADAEIDFLNLLVALQLRGGSLQCHAAGLQHIAVIGDAERERDRLLGKKKRQSLAMQFLERVVEHLDDGRCQSQARFVEHQ